MIKNYGGVRIIALPMLAMLVIFGAFGLFGQWHLGEVLFDWHKEKIVVQANGLSRLIEQITPQSPAEFNEFARENARVLDDRITIMLENGEVIADSSVSVDKVQKMDNHGDRPEMIDAMLKGQGVSLRFSNTLKVDMLYVAVPYQLETTKGVVRVAGELKNVLSLVHEQRQTFFISALVSIFFAGVLGLFASQNLAKRIGRERLKLEDRVTERTKDVRRLQNLGTLLSACNDIEETTEIIERLVPNLLPDVSGALAIFKVSRNSVEITATWGNDWQGELFYAPNECWALRTGRVHPSSEDQRSVICQHLKNLQNCHTYCTPMSAHGEIMGALHLVKKSDPITVEEQQISSVLAEQISLAVANIKLRKSLRDQAIRDSLTGLFNRRFLMEMLNKEIQRAERQQGNIVVMMIDVDHFKKFNDTFGHEAGDKVLARVGVIMREVIRGHDIACRYGGEEFTIVLPGATFEEGANTGERLCTAIRKAKIHSGSKTLDPVTVSVGIAQFPECGATPEELIKTADDALYQAKHNGRDRVELAPQQKAE